MLRHLMNSEVINMVVYLSEFENIIAQEEEQNELVY